MKKKIEIVMAVFLIVAAAVVAPRSAQYVMNMRAETEKTCICIDIGHGGVDPGKVGTAGTKEKDINLQIGLKLRDELKKQGFQAVVTRETDTDLSEEGASSQKVSDMRNRCKLIAQAEPVVVISIHQNSYTDSGARGAQTFYYEASEEGKKFAEILQESLIKNLDPTNHRTAKANDSYYILKNTSVATVIVECGFLSNPEEEAKLKEDEFQNQIVQAICEGTKTYLESLNE